jgi:3-oxoacyl-[acyl-carrier protein] reductase
MSFKPRIPYNPVNNQPCAHTWPVHWYSPQPSLCSSPHPRSYNIRSPISTMASSDLSNQLALITGATGGIGKATCLALAALKCSIAVHYNSASDTAATLVKDLRALGVRAESFQADLSQYDQVRRLHEEVVSKLGHPTILFNNAGTTSNKTLIKAISDISIEDFESTWRANTASAFLLTQLCMPAMESAAFGRIIFCSSGAAFSGGVVGPHYASSKSALHGLIHWLSLHYAAKGITVNGVAPSLIEDTKMMGGGAEMSKRIPVGRFGRPEEIANTVVWMVCTGYVTNKVVSVDGGLLPR